MIKILERLSIVAEFNSIVPKCLIGSLICSRQKIRLVYIAMMSAGIFTLHGCDNGNQGAEKK